MKTLSFETRYTIPCTRSKRFGQVLSSDEIKRSEEVHAVWQSRFTLRQAELDGEISSRRMVRKKEKEKEKRRLEARGRRRRSRLLTRNIHPSSWQRSVKSTRERRFEGRKGRTSAVNNPARNRERIAKMTSARLRRVHHCNGRERFLHEELAFCFLNG